MQDLTQKPARSKSSNQLGVCGEYRANDNHPVGPVFDAKDYFLKHKKGPTVVAKESNNLRIRTETQIEVVKQPRHGRLSLFKPDATDHDTSKYDYHYTPNAARNRGQILLSDISTWLTTAPAAA